MKTITHDERGNATVKQSGPPLEHDKWKAEQDRIHRQDLASRDANDDASAPPAGDDLESLTVAELKERAKAANVEGFSTMLKADLVAALSKK